MTTTPVLTLVGEPLPLLLRALAGITLEHMPNGWARVGGEMAPEPGAAFLRALMRLEAELLLEEADDLVAGGGETRTPEQRRHDAFAELARRIGEAVAART